MMAYILKDRASGLFCAGVDTGRKAVMVTTHLDHAEAFGTQAEADRAAAALAGAGGAFAWAVEERQGDVAARLLARLRHGAGRGVLQAGELSEGQFFAVREMVRLLNASQRHLDRQAGLLDEAGIAFDGRPFSSLYDRLWNMAEPFEQLLLAHFAAKVAAPVEAVAAVVGA